MSCFILSLLWGCIVAALKINCSWRWSKWGCFWDMWSPRAADPLPSHLSSSSPVYLYRLMAVVVHHGDMHSGHFVTYRRSPPSAKHPLAVSSQWLWISDDTVRKASLQEVLSSSAYLLFYERVHSRAQHQSLELRAEEWWWEQKKDKNWQNSSNEIYVAPPVHYASNPPQAL